MTSPRNLLKASQIWPKKELGQHFLNNPDIPRKIVAAAGIAPQDVLVEIGAGLGALTITAAKQAHAVFAVEKDTQIIPLLKTQLLLERIENTTIIPQSFFKVDLKQMAHEAGRRLVILGNLPYNISSQIIVHLIRSRSIIDRSLLMLQQEVAQRLLAPPSTKQYGRLTVMLNYCADMRSILTIAPRHFFPRPKVESEVIEIRFRETYSLCPDDEALLFEVIKAAFGKRRKTLKNALSNSPLPLERPIVQQAITDAGIDPQRRAETLTAHEYVALTRRLKADISGSP